MQGNPLLERIFAAVDDQDSAGAVTSDWRNKIEAASPAEKETVIAQAVREVVGSVLRVKPETLRDDQPLTDLGLDSLMGVEIENSLEAAIGVALPPTSLMRARTIGQIAPLIAGHVGGITPAIAPTPTNGSIPVAQTATTTVEVDLDALSTEEIDRLLGDDDEPLLNATSNV
jgi:acyl carrier protein